METHYKRPILSKCNSIEPFATTRSVENPNLLTLIMKIALKICLVSTLNAINLCMTTV